MAPSPIDPDPALSTTEVADLFEVHPSTVKRWCDRDEMRCSRTSGGHRRIRLSEVLHRARRDEVDVGLTSFGPYAGAVWGALRQAGEEREYARARRLTLDWLDEGAHERVRDFLVHLGSAYPDRLPTFFDRMLREVGREVGRRWESGQLRVGAEHLVSEALTDVVFRLRADAGSRSAVPDPDAPVALVGCGEGERHVLGARAVRLVLENRGWQVRFLGGDVPLEEWAELQRTYDARLICISLSTLRTRADVLRTVRALSVGYEGTRPYTLALGGGMAPGEAQELPAVPFRAIRAFSGIGAFDRWVSRRPAAIAAS